MVADFFRSRVASRQSSLAQSSLAAAVVQSPAYSPLCQQAPMLSRQRQQHHQLQHQQEERQEPPKAQKLRTTVTEATDASARRRVEEATSTAGPLARPRVMETMETMDPWLLWLLRWKQRQHDLPY